MFTPNLDCLKCDAPIQSYTTTEDVKPDSMVYNSYRATIEEARLEVGQKKQEIEYVKKGT